LFAIIATLFNYYNPFNNEELTNQEIDLNRSIAVLPFSNMSSDADSENFTDGVTEDILLQLSKIKELRVI
jgi:TolB-like protein